MIRGDLLSNRAAAYMALKVRGHVCSLGGLRTGTGPDCVRRSRRERLVNQRRRHCLAGVPRGSCRRLGAAPSRALFVAYMGSLGRGTTKTVAPNERPPHSLTSGSLFHFPAAGQAAASIFLGPAAGSAEPPSTPEPAGGPKSSTKSASAAAATGISPAPPPSAEHCKKAAKAFARLGAAREAANERVAAVRAFRRAYELDGSTERCDSLAEAIASVFSSVRCVSGRRTPLRPGEAWRPGDLAADIEPVRRRPTSRYCMPRLGAATPRGLELSKRPPRRTCAVPLCGRVDTSCSWSSRLPRARSGSSHASPPSSPLPARRRSSRVRPANRVQSAAQKQNSPPHVTSPTSRPGKDAGLAECPQHREAFVRQGGGVLALAEAASSIDHYRLPLPPRVADAWRRRCGAPYEASSLLLAAATGLANLTKCAWAAETFVC